MPRKMWFGTEESMRWIDLPSSGADSSPQGGGATGTLLGGGGYVQDSFGAHRQYDYAWSDASTRRAAQVMQDYARGTRGRGLLYFHEPTTYDMNVLPAQWADPSQAEGWEMPPLIRSFDVPMSFAATATPEPNDLPLRSVTYSLINAAVGYPGTRDSLFIPVPPGHRLRLGAIHTRSGGGGVFVGGVEATGALSNITKLTTVAQNATQILPNVAPTGARGVRLWIGKDAAGAATVTLTALIARIIPEARINDGWHQAGPWIGGQGHSGCRFDGKPTYVTYTGIGGGQVGYAASLKEVGSWE